MSGHRSAATEPSPSGTGRARRLAGASLWAGGLAAMAVALQWAGQGPLAPPPLTEPARWAAWLDGRDPVLAAFSLLRLAALAALWYLAGVTALGALLRLAGAASLVRAADRVTIGPVRRMLAGSLSLGLAASGALAVAAPALRLPVAGAQTVATAPGPAATPGAGGQPTIPGLAGGQPTVPGSGAAGAPGAALEPGSAVPRGAGLEPGSAVPPAGAGSQPAVAGLAGAPGAGAGAVASGAGAAPAPTPATVTMRRLGPTEAFPPSPTAQLPPAGGPAPAVSPAGAPAPAVSPAAAGRWSVVPGDCFWSIAEEVLAERLGRAPTDAEIVPYWKRLIEANRAALAHRDNPDLIFPAQVFVVPPP